MKKLVFFVALLFVLFPVKAAEYATFESFYSSGGIGFWGWTFIILGTIAVGTITFLTFGGTAAAAPAWMTAVGTWIGSAAGLSGTAAANFGLALLGGGSIAAGGLGVAGGVAVLAAAMSFGIDMTISYGSDIAIEKWSHTKFIQANKDMVTLPVPRNEKGGKAYRVAISYLQEFIKQDKPISDPENQLAITRAIEIMNEKMPSEKDQDYILKDKTFLSLLYLQSNRYSEASDMAWQAISVGYETKEKITLPSFIWALSVISDPNKTCTGEVVTALQTAYLVEPNNKLISIMTGSCMDRLMYRYHYGQLSNEHLADFCRIISNSKIDKEQAAVSLELFVTRCLIELKRTKQDIYIVTNDKKMMQDKAVIEELNKRFERHKALVSLLQQQALPQVYNLSDKFPKESKITSSNLASLLDSYYVDLAGIEMQIRGNEIKPKKRWFFWF